MAQKPTISVILSTYKAEAWLEKVLWGFEHQSFTDFELVVADDGSGPETKTLLDALQAKLSYPIVYVWQEDDGFQKSRILNKGLLAAHGDYIVMTDGDCIPRADFLAVHAAHMEVGYFLSGGYFMLPMDISKAITTADIKTGNCFELGWLKARGLAPSFKNNKLSARGGVAALLNKITLTNASWNGHNASGFKADILRVNGFDERMQYGGQDRELGERLINAGIQSKQLRYSAIVVHLDHKRGYKNEASIAKNRAIRDAVKAQKLRITPFGIVKG
jgi:glycosyltransferase involved in cell wall biosynthesis